MTHSQTQEGIFEVLVERFEKQRLPRLLEIKDSLDRGGKLSTMDTIFLDEVIRDALHNKHIVDEIPECQALFSRVVHLYNTITDKALENEE